MTSLDEQAEREARDLARMQSARNEQKSRPRKPKSNATATTAAPRARFEVIDIAEPPGLYYIGAARDGDGNAVELAPVWIASAIRVIAYTRDHAGSDWGKLVEFADADAVPHRVAVPAALLAGNGERLRELLLSHGLRLTTRTDHRARLVEFIAEARPDARARCVSRTGWHGSVFVLPGEVVGNTDGEQTILQTSNADGVAIATAGEMAEWRAKVAAPCAGNSRLVLALSTAFAAQCIALLDSEGGGVHFRGKSSSGKTTALQIAASVYGAPEFMRTWRATDSALESVAALHSDMLLPLDEIGQLDPRAAGPAAYMLANGCGKSRSHRDGSAREATRWRVLFLSTGEVGLSPIWSRSPAAKRAPGTRCA